MRNELYDHDHFPRVFLTGEKITVTIRPLGVQAAFKADNVYRIYVKEASLAEEGRFPGTPCTQRFDIKPDEDGCLRVTADYVREGMYLIHLFVSPEDKRRTHEFRVYALEHDMAGRYPFRGDLHMHTSRSDGREGPAVVMANYRAHGYDFSVVSDHHRYYPSLEAREALGIGEDDKSAVTDFLAVCGEEIHLPLNDVHYVNFGGRFSVNALLDPSPNDDKAGKDSKYRSLDGNCPGTMSREAFTEMIKEKAKDVPRELESERQSFAALTWIYEKVKEAKGLGIFPHPYWLCSTQQMSEDYTRFIYEKAPFDAFEVLGGENYFQHNGFQTALYYEMRAKGINHPVVGSTDSHGSTDRNRNALICSTMVFARENTTEKLIDAIKSKYSVAVDTISAEYRLVGDFRWLRYGSFLMENWYPLHDEVCRAEGLYLKSYVTGDESAEKVLLAMKGEIPAMMKKYFAVRE